MALTRVTSPIITLEDVEKQRKSYETAKQWKLRRDFILNNKNHFQPDELIELSWMFVDVELNGKAYSSAIMKQLNRCIRNMGSLDYHRVMSNHIRQGNHSDESSAGNDRPDGCPDMMDVDTSDVPWNWIARGCGYSSVNNFIPRRGFVRAACRGRGPRY